MTFESAISFQQSFDALAVYCADGRFSAQCDDFLRNSLKLANCDRLVLPGGPGALIGHERAAIEQTGVLDDLLFLLDAHEIVRVVLIAHAGCAFYSARLGVGAKEIEMQQHYDLQRADAIVREHRPAVRVEAWFARPTGDDRVRFEPAPLA